MTEKEKVESKILYQDYDREFKVPLSDYALDQDEVRIERFPQRAGLPPEQRPPDYDCMPIRSTDVIVLVESKSASSHPTTSGKFLFTTHEVEVKEVIKDARPTPLRPGDLILVSRPGGRVLINNRPVTIIDHTYTQIELGHQYVLFLRPVPQTGDYARLDLTNWGIDPGFEASDAKLTQLRQTLATCQKEFAARTLAVTV
jgi:hypothetical protein